MAVPPLNERGLLPEGVHHCTLEEAGAAFGVFQGSERRPHLWASFLEFLLAARKSRLVHAIIIDGSFVTRKSNPNDIDLVVILHADHDFSVDLHPDHYNVIAQRQVRKRFGFDIVVVADETESMQHAISFFQQVRQMPGIRKGVLRIVL